MKLITKITLYNLTISSLVFLIGGGITYFIINSIQDKDLHQYFQHKEEKIIAYIQNGEDINAKHSKYTIKKLDQIPKTPSDSYKDTTFNFGKWEVPFRRKTIIREIDGQYYQIFIFKSLEEDNEQIQTALYTLLFLFIALLGILIVFNYFLSIRILRPFNHTLQQIKAFKITDNRKLNLKNSSISEFGELNALLSSMTDTIKQDYVKLKEFTENASHEIQTPLAVIKTKLELLMETPEINKKQSQLIESAYLSASKLSKLSKALTLLTRIDNQEFEMAEELNLSQVLDRLLANFQELIEMKELTLLSTIEENVKIRISPLLADVFISNLLKNAINHNFVKGFIQIILNPDVLIISNTGEEINGSTAAFFERFRKNDQSSDSLGLGLAIVKKICEVNSFDISYVYDEDLHKIEIKFNNE